MRSQGFSQAARLAVAIAAVVGCTLAAPLAAGADPGKTQYVLALGDSATAGTQAIAPAVSPGGSPETQVNRSGEGYADQLVAHLRQEGRKVEPVNLACYYETTANMLSGGSLCTVPTGRSSTRRRAYVTPYGADAAWIVSRSGSTTPGTVSCASSVPGTPPTSGTSQ